MSNSSKLTPKLRFPEFRGKGDWDEKTISDVCELKAGEFVQASQIAESSRNDLYPCYGGNGLRGYVTSYTHEGQYVLVGRQGALCGNVNLFTGKFHATEHALVATPKSGIDTGWLFYSLTKLDLNRYATGQAQPGLSVGVLNGVPTNVPLVEREQRKIADCLSSLNELIAAEGRKLESLRTYKKGVMQQLFPRDGETTARIRALRDVPRVELGKLAELKLGKMLNREKHRTGKLLPYVGVLSLRWNAVDTSRLPQMYFDEDELDRFGLKAGDVLVCEGGTEPGRSAVWDGRLPDLKFQKAVHRVRFTVPFLPSLLVLYLEAIAGTPALESHFTGTGIQHLTRETFAKLKIPYLPIEDQKVIATGVGSLDARIAAESAKLAALRTHKKGLMQQLFPAGEASA